MNLPRLVFETVMLLFASYGAFVLMARHDCLGLAALLLVLHRTRTLREAWQNRFPRVR